MSAHTPPAVGVLAVRTADDVESVAFDAGELGGGVGDLPELSASPARSVRIADADADGELGAALRGVFQRGRGR